MARIVVIEDAQYVRYFLKRVLSGAGHQVFDAAKGKDGLAIFQTEPVDLLVIDLRLPDIRGEEIIRSVRSVHPKIPVIVCSAFVTSETELLQSGVNRVVHKPIDKDELLEAVEDSLTPARRILIATAAPRQLDKFRSELTRLGYRSECVKVLDSIAPQIIYRSFDAAVLWGAWATEKAVEDISREVRNVGCWTPIFFRSEMSSALWNRLELFPIPSKDPDCEAMYRLLVDKIGLQRIEQTDRVYTIQLAGQADREDILATSIDEGLNERKHLLFDLRQVRYLGPFEKKLLHELPIRSQHLHLSLGMLPPDEPVEPALKDWLKSVASEYERFDDRKAALRSLSER